MAPTPAHLPMQPHGADAPLDVAVIGAGMAGLAAAWRAHTLGLRVAVFEATRHVGGKQRSERKDGFLVEHGPYAFDGAAHAVWQLIAELGLQDRVVAGPRVTQRYVYRDRSLRHLPTRISQLWSTDALSWSGKLRMLAEPFILGDARPDDTVWSLAVRRFGEEAARYVVTPLVQATTGSDPRHLGAREALPKLWQWEHDAGSVALGGLLCRAAQSDEATNLHDPGRLYSFADGMDTLPRAMVDQLPAGTVRLGAAIDRLVPTATGWQLHLHPAVAAQPHLDGAWATETPIFARTVILATPARPAAELLQPLCPEAAAALADVQSVRFAVVHVGGPDLSDRAPRGTSVYFPRGEGLRTLALFLPARTFSGRAPQGCWLHTGFLGGAGDPEVADLPDEMLVSLVLRAQGHAFGSDVAALPDTFHTVIRWRDAIPQFRVGHAASMARAQAALARHCPGLAMAGSHVGGVTVTLGLASGLTSVETLWPSLVARRAAVPAALPHAAAGN